MRLITEAVDQTICQVHDILTPVVMSYTGAAETVTPLMMSSMNLNIIQTLCKYDWFDKESHSIRQLVMLKAEELLKKGEL
jgi:hypothetical protein